MQVKSFIKSLITCLILALFIQIGMPEVSNAAPNNNTAIKQKLQSNQVKLRSTKEKIRNLKVQEQREKNKLVKNQKRLEAASNNLAITTNKYQSMESKLKDMESQYNSISSEYSSVDAQIKERIRNIYKSQRVGMFDLIFGAKDLNSMLDIIYFERVIIKNDYKQMMSLKERAAKLAKLKTDIEAQKVSLAQSLNEQKNQKRSIQEAIAQNTSMINRLKNNRAAYERAERELAQQSQSLQSMLSAYSNSTVKVASTGFMKPIGGKITSPFGWRTHPIFKSRTFHSGVDIGGPNLGSIKASNSGKVIYTGWYGGYGKVVIIDHGVINGNPTTTLYAHMSSIKVGNGQNVTKGQVIGLEGSTGYSTGPHCHFEVRINGRPNNPLNYI